MGVYVLVNTDAHTLPKMVLNWSIVFGLPLLITGKPLQEINELPGSMVTLLNAPVEKWLLHEQSERVMGLISLDRPMTYFEAQEMCKDKGADGLAEIYGQEEQDWINEHMSDNEEILAKQLPETLAEFLDLNPCKYNLAWIGAQRYGSKYWEWHLNPEHWNNYRNWLNDKQEFKRVRSNRMCLQMVISPGQSMGKWRSATCQFSACPMNPLTEFSGSTMALCQKKQTPKCQ